MKSKLTFAVTLVALFIFVMCEWQNAQAATPTDACSLLTPEQIQKVLGQPFGPPKVTPLLPPFGTQ